MKDGFEEMVAYARPFFRDLRQNNSKDWFDPRKADYVERIRKPGELFADIFADELRDLTGAGHGAKVYRIYRDVRFSADKSPYNPWLHILWTQGGGTAASPAWFFACDADGVSLAVGIVGLDSDQLKRFRGWIDRDGDVIRDTIDGIAAATGGGLSDWGPEPLKRVPAPYAQDHPHAPLLRRKCLIVTVPFADTIQERGLIPVSREAVQTLMPLWTLLQDGL